MFVSPKKSRLREGEKKKFRPDGKTDKESGISYSGDEIMGFVERDTMVLIPAAVTAELDILCRHTQNDLPRD